MVVAMKKNHDFFRLIILLALFFTFFGCKNEVNLDGLELRALKEEIKKDPNSAKAHFQLAQYYFENGKYNKTVDTLNKVDELYKNYPAANSLKECAIKLINVSDNSKKKEILTDCTSKMFKDLGEVADNLKNITTESFLEETKLKGEERKVELDKKYRFSNYIDNKAFNRMTKTEKNKCYKTERLISKVTDLVEKKKIIQKLTSECMFFEAGWYTAIIKYIEMEDYDFALNYNNSALALFPKNPIFQFFKDGLKEITESKSTEMKEQKKNDLTSDYFKVLMIRLKQIRNKGKDLKSSKNQATPTKQKEDLAKTAFLFHYDFSGHFATKVKINDNVIVNRDGGSMGSVIIKDEFLKKKRNKIEIFRKKLTKGVGKEKGIIKVYLHNKSENVEYVELLLKDNAIYYHAPSELKSGTIIDYFELKE